MKRLIVALVAAVAVSTAFAKLTYTQGFEGSSVPSDDFVPSDPDEDSSALAEYEVMPDIAVPYDFTGLGKQYLLLDTGDATLWRTNAGDATYFDMVMQFNPSSVVPTLDAAKIAVYLNASSNLVVMAGDGNGGTSNDVTSVELAPGSWARLTIAVTDAGFIVRLGGTVLGPYPSRDGIVAVNSVGFNGSGALDDFVARTTDPFIQNPAVTIGGEGYASLADAIADDPEATPQLESDVALSTPLAYGESISVKLNNHTLSGITSGLLVAVESTSDDVTTYTATYFPRTATAGQDGTAANPYEIADVDDIQALQAAFADDATFRSKNYKLVANIDATGLGYFDGIGTASGTIKDDGLNGGTFDGNGYTISNLSFSADKYRAFFNCATNAVIKDLTINVAGFGDTDKGEHGYAAFVGNMDNTTLLRCVATGTLGTTEKPAMHTAAGFAVKVNSRGVFVDCTNRVNIVCSLTDNPKIGGIVGLMQGGALTNCWNEGALTITVKTCGNDANGAGGLVGYAQTSTWTISGGGNAGIIQSTDDTTAASPTYDIHVGTVVGKTGSALTVVDGVVAQADAAPAGVFNNISGLTYATVDNNVATFVPDADLAAGNTYVLQQNVAASETPVYTFDAAGTIAFDTANGFTFAGTVAADTTTLVLAEPVTEGTVTTYAATAGVAAVDDFAYATFDEAVEALEGETEEDFVTLLADVTTTISAGTTLKVKINGKNFTANKESDDVIIGYKTVDGVTTYTATEGLASLNGTWYATFEEAYSHSGAVTDTMVVKISGDFNPVLDGSRTFATVTFTNTNESAASLVINTVYNSYTFKSSNWVFPKNATLSLSGTYTLISANGGTLNIPDGTVITANGQTALDNVDLVTGDGKLIAPPNPTFFLYYSKLVTNKVLTNALWTGTFELASNYDYPLDLSALGNSESTVLFNGFTVKTFGNSNSTYAMNIELVANGLTLNGDYTRTYTFTGDLSGTGSLNVTAMGGGGSYIFLSGDTSGFAGSVNLASTTARVVFGGTTSGGGGSITVADGKSVTIPATSSWTATDLVVVGDLVANGPVTISGSLWGNSGTGVYRANTNAAAVTAASSWNGTYIVGWNPAESTYFNIANFGIHADAKIVFNGTWPSGAYLGNGSAGAYTISSELQLDSPIVIDNGFSGSGNVVTFSKLSGSANLTTRRYDYVTDSVQCYYAISWLENYTGELIVRDAASLDIGIVNVPSGTSLTDRIVKVTKSKYYDSSVAEGVVTGDLKLYVDGVDTGKTLEYKADGSQGAGLYVAASVAIVEIRVPAIEHATATVTTNGVEVAASGAGTYEVEEGAAVTITYEAASGYILSGTSQYTIASAEQGSTITITDTEVAAEIAAVYRNDSKVEGYTSLRAAIAAAQAGDTVRLLADDRVSFANVTVTDRVPSGGSIVIDKNLTIDGANYTVYGVSNAEILNATGASAPGYDMAADLVDGSNLIGFFVKSGNVTFTNVTLTEFGDTAYVNKFGYTPIQTASAYAGTLTLTGVNFNKFNRTAVCIRGGTLAMTGGAIAGGTVNKNNGDYFQQPVEVRGGTATIDGVTITGGNDIAGNGGGAIVAWGAATLTNVVVNFTGYGIWSDGPAVSIVGEDTAIKATVNALFAEEAGTIAVAAGAFEGVLAVDSDPASAISLTGGTFDRDVNAFCASGYEAKESAGVWTVSVKTSEPVTPGEDDGKTYDSAEDAAAAAAKVEIGATAAVEAAVGAAGLEAYLAKFEGKVVDNGDGTFKVVVVLKASEEAKIADNATTNVMVTVAASLPDIIADAASEQTEVTVSNVVPGFYYSISYGTEADSINTEGVRVLAPASGTLTLQTPAKASGATAGFYKVNVNLVP